MHPGPEARCGLENRLRSLSPLSAQPAQGAVGDAQAVKIETTPPREFLDGMLCNTVRVGTRKQRHAVTD